MALEESCVVKATSTIKITTNLLLNIKESKIWICMHDYHSDKKKIKKIKLSEQELISNLFFKKIFMPSQSGWISNWKLDYL